ncbi:hypothetical protein CLI64_15900 [Nostoc sp. CENA543]|uniref:DUF1036 domain-containing protein n=1 Tax=Nostoc sp. CENA543 TaxID=1869241 RepID=UPI000CA337B2|nr:DUF1036 domain-containing protein [Nostoc sp. CENA543]AUT01750.1 hypothetical protein CLI64_15900 [Nostoc sp. CENA543]
MKAVNSLFISGLLSMPLVMGTAVEAKADLIVCSSASDKAYVAKAWYSEGSWVASGWTHVNPGECETVLIGDMRRVSTYIYAADNEWRPWELQNRSTAIFCLKQSSFKIVDADGSCSSSMLPKTFYKVVSDRYDYRLNLR